MDRAVGQVLDADILQRCVHALAHSVDIQPEVERAEGDIFAHARRKELLIRVLKDQADGAA